MFPFSDIDLEEVKSFIKANARDVLDQSYIEYLCSEVEIAEQINNKLKNRSHSGINSDIFVKNDQLEVFLLPKSFDIDLSTRLTYLVGVVLESMSASSI